MGNHQIFKAENGNNRYCSLVDNVAGKRKKGEGRLVRKLYEFKTERDDDDHRLHHWKW